eukprot:1447047-Pyramimonas_sp.AAC.1
MSPSFWDTPPKVGTLREASLGFPSSPAWSEAGNHALKAGLSASRDPKAKLQRVTARELHLHLLPPSLHSTFKSRLLKWYPDSRGPILRVDWSTVRIE